MVSDREKPAARLHILFATDAPIAVILRTGPSRHTQMWLWETDCDRFTPGQWFKQAVYPHACHLHPSGKYVFLSLGDYRRRGGKWWERQLRSYQTISRPPYFTALAFLPVSETSRTKGGLSRDVRLSLIVGFKNLPIFVEMHRKTGRSSPSILLGFGAG